MHSLDTVKTRQQGDPHVPSKYTSLGQSYYTIWRQEGIRRGLYGGWIPALGGSFPGTVMFFGTYEWSKRFLIDHGVQQHLSYLSAGITASARLNCSSRALTNLGRLPWRFSRLHRLRPIRGSKNPTSAPGPLQQPPFHIGLQLPRHSRRCPHHCPY